MSVLQNLLKNGLVWSFVDNVLLKGITFIVTIVLARILTPNDFGLLGIITIFISLGNAIIEGGMGNSIVRDNKSTSSDYNAVFYGNLMISLILYPILFFTAPFLSKFFNNDIIIPLIRVYGLSFIISAFFYIQYSIFLKEMSFKKITAFNIPAVITGAVVGLASAYLGKGVWSLVYMQLATLVFKVLFYWMFSSWTPELGFSFKVLQKHLNFGYKLMISSIMDAAMREVYSFIIGKHFSIKTLGYFNHSKGFRNYPVNLLSTVVSSVTFPLLSKIQDDKEKVGRLYAKILRSIFFIFTPFMVALIVVAKPLFLLLFTAKWLPAVPYFQLLAISGTLIPIHVCNLNIFKIFNRTDLFLKLEVIKVILVCASLAIGYFWGVFGLLYAIIGSSILGLFVNTYYGKKLIAYGTLDQLSDMFPIVLFASVSYFLGTYVLLQADSLHIIVQLIVGVVFTLVSYLALAILFKSKSLIEVKGLGELILKRN